MPRPSGNRAEMLKPDGQLERKRGRPTRWALLLLVLPLVLIGWALVGMNVRLGDWEFESGWEEAATWNQTLSWKGPFAARTIHNDNAGGGLIVDDPSGTVYDRADTLVVIAGDRAYFANWCHLDRPGTAAWKRSLNPLRLGR